MVDGVCNSLRYWKVGEIPALRQETAYSCGYFKHHPPKSTSERAPLFRTPEEAYQDAATRAFDEAYPPKAMTTSSRYRRVTTLIKREAITREVSRFSWVKYRKRIITRLARFLQFRDECRADTALNALNRIRRLVSQDSRTDQEEEEVCKLSLKLIGNNPSMDVELWNIIGHKRWMELFHVHDL